MKFKVKSAVTGTENIVEVLGNLNHNDIAIITKQLEKGGIGIRDYDIIPAQSDKAYKVSDEDMSLVAKALGKSNEWVKSNLSFYRMCLSDTTIDSERDKFSEAVIRELGKQYSEKWEQGQAGGRTQCVMHIRNQMVGKTYKHEVIDAKNEAGDLVLDENGAGVKQLIGYCYVSNTAIYNGEPVVNYLADGRLSKVSISAYLGAFEYISSDRSNWTPPGATSPQAYFYYANPEGVFAVENSFVDLGANAGAQVLKAKKAEVGVIVETPPAYNEINVNVADYPKMKWVWDNLPISVKNAPETVVWEEVQLSNHGDGKAFYAPNFCAVRLRNMDNSLGKQKDRIKELEGEVTALQLEKSNQAEKVLSLEEQLSKTTATLQKFKAQIDADMQVEANTYACLKAELEAKTTDLEAIEGYKKEALSLDLVDLRKANAGLNVTLKAKREAVFSEEPKLILNPNTV